MIRQCVHHVLAHVFTMSPVCTAKQKKLPGCRDGPRLGHDGSVQVLFTEVQPSLRSSSLFVRFKTLKRRCFELVLR